MRMSHAATVVTGLAVFLIAFPTLSVGQSTTNSNDTDRESKRQRAFDLAGRLDEMLERRFEDELIEPAQAAEDAEFLRRAYLDLVGTIPPAAVVREYLAETSEDKRFALIDRLLDSPRHATHLASTWRHILLPDGFPAERSQDAIGLQRWLRDRFAENVRYDRIVGDFLTATGSTDTGPALFYQALEVKPEKLAASTARSFLGIQIQCAQCHDHPFDDWTQRNFWEYAAFFAQVEGNPGMAQQSFELRDRRSGEVTLPEEDEPIPPAFPGDEEANAVADGPRRLQLSIWLSSGSNPYLARATANRVWWHFFGRGFVDPVDDISEANEPSHPEALAALSQFFIDSRFDLHELMRAVAYTDAYARSSRYPGDQRPLDDLFAVMQIKNLSAEQIFDSLVEALQNSPSWSPNDAANNSLANPVRQQFLARMSTEASQKTEYTAGLQQTLLLMNQPELETLMSDPERGLLAALEAPFLSQEDRLAAMFLSVLSRFPNGKERQIFGEHLALAETDAQPAAMADIVWAMVNSAEFRMNH